MMALSGVRNSWLILARKSDFLYPALAAQRNFEGGTRFGAHTQAVGQPRFALAGRHGDLASLERGANEILETRAGDDLIGDAREGEAEFLIAQDEAVLGIEESKTFRDALDRLRQLVLQAGRTR